MRRFVRVVVLALGGLFTLVGVVAAVLVGPDDTISTGDRELSTDTAALATAPSAHEFMGPTLHVAAESRDGDVFIGVGHEVDVRSYLDGVAHERVVRVGLPWSPELQPREGSEDAAAVAPDTRDWWYAQTSGSGRRELAYELGGEPVSVVVMSADGAAPVSVHVDVGMELENLFMTCLLVAGVGVALLLVGVFVPRRRSRKRRAATAAADDDADDVWHPAGERPL